MFSYGQLGLCLLVFWIGVDTMYVLSWSVGPLSFGLLNWSWYHVCSLMVSWAFVSLFCAFWFISCAQCVLSLVLSVGPLSLCLVLIFTPCAQCVLSVTWSVGPLSLCLVLSNFYTMCTVCSLTDMVSWAFVSLSYEFQIYTMCITCSLTDMVSWAFVSLSYEFQIYTMCTMCSLTDMVSWVFVSLSYEFQFYPMRIKIVFFLNPLHTVFALTS